MAKTADEPIISNSGVYWNSINLKIGFYRYQKKFSQEQQFFKHSIVKTCFFSTSQFLKVQLNIFFPSPVIMRGNYDKNYKKNDMDE